MGIKDVVKEALENVKRGSNDPKDHAIEHLVRQLQGLKAKLTNCKEQKDDEQPLHKQKPWYMD